jgi:hypothetical protein
MDATIMKVRCDYCCGKLGLMVHRYWHMRFCSSACTQSYEQRLDETKARMCRLFGRGEDASAINGLPGASAVGI